MSNYKQNDLLSPHDLSVLWNTSVGIIAKMRASGDGPPFTRFGREIRYRFGDVVEFRGTVPGSGYKRVNGRAGPWRNKLTKKQEEFCKDVAEGLSRTVAYRNHYATRGYSRAQIIRSANALLKLDKIKNRIASIPEGSPTTSDEENQIDKSIYEPVAQYGSGPPPTEEVTDTSAIVAYGKLAIDAGITPVFPPDYELTDAGARTFGKTETRFAGEIKPLEELTHQQSKTVDSLISKIQKYGALVSLERALLHADITVKLGIKHGHTEPTQASNCAAMHYEDIKEERNECREDIRNSLYLALDIAFDDGHKQGGIR